MHDFGHGRYPRTLQFHRSLKHLEGPRSGEPAGTGSPNAALMTTTQGVASPSQLQRAFDGGIDCTGRARQPNSAATAIPRDCTIRDPTTRPFLCSHATQLRFRICPSGEARLIAADFYRPDGETALSGLGGDPSGSAGSAGRQGRQAAEARRACRFSPNRKDRFKVVGGSRNDVNSNELSNTTCRGSARHQSRPSPTQRHRGRSQ